MVTASSRIPSRANDGGTSPPFIAKIIELLPIVPFELPFDFRVCSIALYHYLGHPLVVVIENVADPWKWDDSFIYV